MGETRPACGLPDASGGRSASRLVARHPLIDFLRREDGATAIEYGLIAALIAGTIIVGVMSLSQSIQDNLYSVIQAAIIDGD